MIHPITLVRGLTCLMQSKTIAGRGKTPVAYLTALENQTAVYVDRRLFPSNDLQQPRPPTSRVWVTFLGQKKPRIKWLRTAVVIFRFTRQDRARLRLGR